MRTVRDLASARHRRTLCTLLLVCSSERNSKNLGAKPSLAASPHIAASASARPPAASARTAVSGPRRQAAQSTAAGPPRMSAASASPPSIAGRTVPGRTPLVRVRGSSHSSSAQRGSPRQLQRQEPPIRARHAPGRAGPAPRQDVRERGELTRRHRARYRLHQRRRARRDVSRSA